MYIKYDVIYLIIYFNTNLNFLFYYVFSHFDKEIVEF